MANLICVSISNAQVETVTVQGNLPRFNYRDPGGNLLWSLPANNVLWKIDGPFNAGVIVVTAAAPSGSIVANEGGVSIRGGGFPSAKLQVGNINDATQPGEVKIDPGNPAATGSIFVQNQSLDAELRLVTQSAAKQSSVRMVSPNGHFTTSVAGTTGRYIIRDVTNAASPMTIIPGTLNNNTLVLKDGKIGVGVLNPTSPIHVSNGATCSVGGGLGQRKQP